MLLCTSTATALPTSRLVRYLSSSRTPNIALDCLSTAVLKVGMLGPFMGVVVFAKDMIVSEYALMSPSAVNVSLRKSVDMLHEERRS